MHDDDKLRTLADWIEGWEPVRELEQEISEVWKRLKELRVRVAEQKAHLLKTCPLSLTELEMRFWSKVDIIDDDHSCWEWRASRRPVIGEEYGLFRLDGNGRDPGGTIGAHRMAFVLTNGGKIPDHTRHKCDNPPCVRPQHLEDGTHADNMRDKAARGRARGKINQQGEANDSAVLTEAIVIDARKRSKAGETQKSIADSYGVQVAALGYAIRGQTWNHLDKIEAPHERRIGGGSRLSEEDIRNIRIDAANGASATLLAQRHGISTANVYAIISRRSWKHVE